MPVLGKHSLISLIFTSTISGAQDLLILAKENSSSKEKESTVDSAELRDENTKQILNLAMCL